MERKTISSLQCYGDEFIRQTAEMGNFVQMSSNFRSEIVEYLRRSSRRFPVNPCPPFSFQPVEPKILAKWI